MICEKAVEDEMYALVRPCCEPGSRWGRMSNRVGGVGTQFQQLMLDPSGNPLTQAWRQMAALLWREIDEIGKWESVIIKKLLLETSSLKSQSEPGRQPPGLELRSS